ncbi:MAG: polyprenyl diphosphate synthase [Ilumatobacteraceae bacterium]
MHVACIMDGNGRWAKRRGLPRTEGHTAGEENLAAIVRASVARRVDFLTVFGFSTENWVRPRHEVRHILGLHEKLFGRLDELNANNVRVLWIGRPFDDPRARTPRYVQRAIERAIADTAQNTGMTLTVAFDYGSRAEITDAARRVQNQRIAPTVASLTRAMYAPDLPPVDVLIRTSGEMRVSNFMLWQAAGAPIHFSANTWPEFDVDDLEAALHLAAGATR